ncbi:TrmH family RNA methyltransferase [Myxococcota bacterium]
MPNHGAVGSPSTGTRLVVGLQPVREAIRVRAVALRRVALEQRPSRQLEALAQFARDQGVRRVDRVGRSELDRACRGIAHQGAIAWAPPLELADPEPLLRRPTLLGIALDGVEDPQNFGALVRSAVALCGAPVFWGIHSSAPLSPAMFRASAGAVEHAVLCQVRSLRELLTQATAAGVCTIGLDAHAQQTLASMDLTGPTLLVLGGEHKGISRGVRAACTRLACLGRLARMDSLNVSVAAGIALYQSIICRANSYT